MQLEVLPILLLVIAVVGLALALLLVANLINPTRAGRVKRMPYESGMDPVHDTRRRFDVRYYLIAIAFLVFDVELLFLYPWAVVFTRPAMAEDSPPALRASERPASPGTAGPSAAGPSVAGPEAAGNLAQGRDGGPERPAIAEAAGAAEIGSNTVVRRPPYVFVGGMLFLGLLLLGYVYDWRKGIYRWR